MSHSFTRPQARPRSFFSTLLSRFLHRTTQQVVSVAERMTEAPKETAEEERRRRRREHAVTQLHKMNIFQLRRWSRKGLEKEVSRELAGRLLRGSDHRLARPRSKMGRSPLAA
jgi:hypothetical protein